MKPDPQSLIMLLAVGWFVVYWIMGGVVFAIVTAARFVNVKKARFSCLFTLASVGAAYGAAVTGSVLSDRLERACIGKAPELFDALWALLSCSPRGVGLGGALWFILLLLAGLVVLLISRAEKRQTPPQAR